MVSVVYVMQCMLVYVLLYVCICRSMISNYANCM